jgi:uncharacterized membrane protein
VQHRGLGSCRTVLLCCLIGFSSSALAHGTESRDTSVQTSQAAAESEGTHGASTSEEFSLNTVVKDLSWSGFPTLHPLVVHVPVTFIPLAFVLSLASLFVAKRALIWVVLGLALAGLGGALVAAFPLHPHTVGLSKAARMTLEKHEFFAFGTLWLAIVAVLAMLLNLWHPRLLTRIFVTLVLLAAAVFVSIAGHYGGTLAYVHGVGVKGQYLL